MPPNVVGNGRTVAMGQVKRRLALGSTVRDVPNLAKDASALTMLVRMMLLF